MSDGRGLRDTYQRNLRKHAHELIAMDYHELNPKDYANSEEPAITGELVRVMREILERDSSPRWVEHYAIHDDPPLNVSDRQAESVHVSISNSNVSIEASVHVFASKRKDLEKIIA